MSVNDDVGRCPQRPEAARLRRGPARASVDMHLAPRVPAPTEVVGPRRLRFVERARTADSAAERVGGDIGRRAVTGAIFVTQRAGAVRRGADVDRVPRARDAEPIVANRTGG